MIGGPTGGADMSERTLSLDHVRRLAVTRQRLAGPRPGPGREEMLGVVRDLGCLQVDPISVVDRSHRLVLWSRLGPYDGADLEALRWEERALFEYWAHQASIVLTEDYPLHRLLMRRYPTDRYAHGRRTREWLERNPGLRRSVLVQLRRRGPLRLRDFADRTSVSWTSEGWTSDRNVERMLDVLWTQGKVVIAGREGGQRWWDLAERWFPAWMPHDRLSDRQIVRRAAQRSLRALGVATERQIERHFTAGRYPGLPRVLVALRREGVIQQVRVVDDGTEGSGPWFVHREDLPLLEGLQAGAWEPRTTLLSPFDNLIIDRERTEQVFGVRFRMEIYVPKAQRRFGYYALPVLHGDRLIGRVDPVMDRKKGVLRVNAVHAEPGADAGAGAAAGRAIRRAIEDLATFLGAVEIAFPRTAPARWARALR